MIPPVAEILAAQRFVARSFDLDPACDEALIAECLREAAGLAGGRIEDELAATLFALTRRWGALRAGWERVPLRLLSNGAAARGLMIDCDPADFDLLALRLRIVTREASFDEVRAWVAARLRPLP